MSSQRASNIEVKKINRNRTFRFVNNFDKVSKPDIASALGISMPTVMQNIKELSEKGLIKEVGEFKSTGGRKAMAITAISDNHSAVGIDITSNHIGLVISDLSGKVKVHKRIFKPFEDTREYYKEMASISLEFKNEHINKDTIFLGFGISIPGIIDNDNKTIVYSHTLKLRYLNVKVISEFIPYPCIFINDANAAGYAEIYHEKTPFNAVYLSLSNSVGGAIIQEKHNILTDNPINEKLYLGDNNRSSEFGHMTLYPNGGECYCGKKGCVDFYCSSKKLASYSGDILEQFFVKLATDDQELLKVWDEYLFNLAVTINNLRMIFDCSVIIGGYVGSYIEPFMDRLKDKVASLNTFENDSSYIVTCKYRVESSALGAALQHIEAFIHTV